MALAEASGVIFVFNAVHQLGDFLRIIGMRDRLRCPECGAVGTWKPHGGWCDWGDTRGIRRWLCKWCGHYRDARARRLAVIPMKEMEPRAWQLIGDPGVCSSTANTPKEACEAAFWQPVNPWVG